MNQIQELHDFLLLEFPKHSIKEDRFLDIIGYYYKENSISQAYSYFINREKNKESTNLYLPAHKELIYFGSSGCIWAGFSRSDISC